MISKAVSIIKEVKEVKETRDFEGERPRCGVDTKESGSVYL